VNHHIGAHLSDKELINLILRGDNRAFGAVIKNTEGLVAQIVVKMIPIAEERKDIIQDIYLKTFHNLSGFKFQSKLSTWIARITYNTCLSWIEKKKLVLPGNVYQKDPDPEQIEPSHKYLEKDNESENRLLRKELSAILQKEIAGLPPVYQTLIVLFHQESISYEELVQITGLPEGTIKSSLFRARKMLKENLLSKYKKEAL
jgi:RNA polymerase sigma factor (sigma-70 family)